MTNNNSYYQCQYFSIQELVHPDLLSLYGERRCWQFFSPLTLRLIDKLRERFGPCVINDYFLGGNLKNCGLRVAWDNTYAKMSIHKFGGAFDLHFKNLTPQQVYKAILEEEEYWVAQGLHAMEKIECTPTWLHVDSRNVDNNNKIYLFNG